MEDSLAAHAPSTALEAQELSTDALILDGKDMTDQRESTKVQESPLETSIEDANDVDVLAAQPQESSELTADDLATQGHHEEVDATQVSQAEDQHIVTPEEMQAQQAQYAALMPHGHQPYYHDSMLQPLPVQYQHPQASYMGQIPNPPGTKAKRKRASPHQLALLNQIFEYTFFPSTELRNAIGKELGMAPRTVQIWFQNRRQSWRAQKSRDKAEDSTKSNDNERGGWEVLRSFQARRANGEIQEYEYMAIPASGTSGLGIDPRTGQAIEGFSMTLPQYQHHMIPAALSSNDQFNASMQQLPGLLPHAPQLNFAKQQQQNGHAAVVSYHPQQQRQQQQQQQQHPPLDTSVLAVAATAEVTETNPVGALSELDPRLDKD